VIWASIISRYTAIATASSYAIGVVAVNPLGGAIAGVVKDLY
jgi:hypothetical protein